MAVRSLVLVFVASGSSTMPAAAEAHGPYCRTLYAEWHFARDHNHQPQTIISAVKHPYNKI
eukprot:scaffold5314_cov91-Isochrysis_galbana.AAC.2